MVAPRTDRSARPGARRANRCCAAADTSHGRSRRRGGAGRLHRPADDHDRPPCAVGHVEQRGSDAGCRRARPRARRCGAVQATARHPRRVQLHVRRHRGGSRRRGCSGVPEGPATCSARHVGAALLGRCRWFAARSIRAGAGRRAHGRLVVRGDPAAARTDGRRRSRARLDPARPAPRPIGAPVHRRASGSERRHRCLREALERCGLHVGTADRPVERTAQPVPAAAGDGPGDRALRRGVARCEPGHGIGPVRHRRRLEQRCDVRPGLQRGRRILMDRSADGEPGGVQRGRQPQPDRVRRLHRARLAFGVAHPAWADNSNSTGDNPDGTLHGLDVYSAAIAEP